MNTEEIAQYTALGTEVAMCLIKLVILINASIADKTIDPARLAALMEMKSPEDFFPGLKG